MADAGQQIVDYGVNTGAGMAARAILGRNLPVPMPDFYNPNSQHPFRDSQAGQMLHGNRQAWAGYGRRAARAGINTGAAMATGGLSSLWQLGAGAWNMIMPDRLDIPQQYTSLGNLIIRDPQGTVGGSPATIENGLSTAGGISIDPWTGQQVSGLPNYMPDFTGGAGYSSYGPYAGGYQGLPDDGTGGGGPAMPDFSHYSDPLFQEADQDNNGHLTPNERRDYGTWGGAHSIFGDGTGPRSDFQGTVTNFMANGSPVILGVRPGMGDMNGLMVYNGRDVGG